MEAKIDGVFSSVKDKEDEDSYKIRKFYDLKDLMTLSRYSNAKHDLVNILKGSQQSSNTQVLPS